METTKTEKISVCFAYYGDGKFLGWYADSFGSIRANAPKLYPYNTEQQKIVFNNFKSKLQGVVKDIAEKIGQHNTSGAELIAQSESKDQVILSAYKIIELRTVQCPYYDGPNPDFDEAKYKEWVEKEKAAKGKDFKYADCPAELNNWIYVDYSKVKLWASIKPTSFLDRIEVKRASYTSTPWIIRKEEIGYTIWSEVQNGGTTESEVVACLEYKDDENLPNAKRIVECVNAMEGIDDPQGFVNAHKAAIDLIKQSGNDFIKLAKLILKVKQDKKILLEAMTKISELHPDGNPENAIKIAKKAIEDSTKKMSKEELE